MAINNVTLNSNVQSIRTSTVATADSESKNLEHQIASKQQRLSRLSSDAEMTAEEKAKERQEVQKQIEELNRKLRQIQLEQKEKAEEAAKEQEQKAALKEQMLGETTKKETQGEDFAKAQEERIEKHNPPVESIQKMLAVDSVVQQERVLGSVDRQKAGRENVLEAEIKSDEVYGMDVTHKKEELSALRREGSWEIEAKEQSKQPHYIMDSGAKIIIR